MLTIHNQTHAGKIFKCTIFVGYGGVVFFYWCRTIRSCGLFDWFTDEQACFQLDCGHRLKLGKVDHLFNSYSYYLYFFISQFDFQS